MIHLIKTRKAQFNKLLSSISGAGKQFPPVEFSAKHGIWKFDMPQEKDTVTIADIAKDKPLLITYFAPEWGEYSTQQLWLLQKSVRRLTELGVKILTLTNINREQIEELCLREKLKFSLYFDENQHLAKSIGIFFEQTPCTHFYAGISENIPLPASFLVLPNGLIIHHFIDIELKSYLSYKEIEVFVNNYKNFEFFYKY